MLRQTIVTTSTTQTGAQRVDYERQASADRKIEGSVNSPKSGENRKTEANGRSKLAHRPEMANTSLPGVGSDDKLTYINNILHWDVSSLVLFIDRRGQARIPSRFFRAVCERKSHGSPGPMYRTLFKIGVLLVAVSIYLVFVTIVVVRLLDVAYVATSGSQAVAVLIAGSPPLVFYFIGSLVRRRRGTTRTVLNDTIRAEMDTYRQAWPVYDLSFQTYSKLTPATGSDRCESTDDVMENGDVTSIGNESIANCGHASTTAVDLLITLRDDSEFYREDGGATAEARRRRLVDLSVNAGEQCSPIGAVMSDQPQSSRTSTL